MNFDELLVFGCFLFEVSDQGTFGTGFLFLIRLRLPINLISCVIFRIQSECFFLPPLRHLKINERLQMLPRLHLVLGLLNIVHKDLASLNQLLLIVNSPSLLLPLIQPQSLHLVQHLTHGVHRVGDKVQRELSV